ncbi:MAG TPA: hypothetical protein VFQ24_11320 [Terriglobia bacterium]|nr:hypothetical protein [Terriglobia bacterium]
MGKDVDFVATDLESQIVPGGDDGVPSADTRGAAGADAGAEAPAQPAPWPIFLRKATGEQIQKRLVGEFSSILNEKGLGRYCALALLEPMNSIDSYDLDKIFEALSQQNAARGMDVMLLLLSRGGEIEPAYQISKVCKSFACNKFVAVVPRHAKSAATLVALGADEIHMGPLGQLGPIDPQIGKLPALGVSQALKTLASVAQEYPGSADLFSRYLREVLTVEQIGYCDRISESAVQYATRLLSTKIVVPGGPDAAAKLLVHEYKDHGFVIDIEEARRHLGEDWIKTDTRELAAAEVIYSLFEMINFFLELRRPKSRLIVAGGLTLPDAVVIMEEPRRTASARRAPR